MLIKEYRICLPLTVSEYRIAQLYMIQKKSREESTGRGSGVEIIKNDPYENGPGGSGQYTFKVYHVANHLPAWLRSLLPPSALRVEEEAWNAYPYTRTIYRVPFVDKLTLDIETYYFDDDGRQDDVFNLTPEEKKMRIVDFIDIVQDSIPKSEYKPEEDPVLYVSKATGRGPLSPDWRQVHYRAQSSTHETHTNSPTRTSDNREPTGPLSPLPKRIMCAYKLCRVEFRYWGMQRKIEQFIHDSALRKTMVRAHRQVWTWQDEWYGLTIEEIRQLEAETAKALSSKMTEAQTSTSGHDDRVVYSNPSDLKVNTEINTTALPIRPNSSEPALATRSHSRLSDRLDDVEGLNVWHTLKRLENEGLENQDDEFGNLDDDALSFVSCRSYFTANTPYMSATTLAMDGLGASEGAEDLGSALIDGCPSPSLRGSENSEKLALLLVVHGGCLLDATGDLAAKEADLQTFKRTVDIVLSNHYPILRKHIAIRLVPCPSELATIFQSLVNLKPSPMDPSVPVEVQLARDILPLGTIPFFLTTSESYPHLLHELASRLNATYADFIHSPEGSGFSGFVCLLADSVGAMITYDLLNHVARLDSSVGISVTDAGVRRWREPTSMMTNGEYEAQQQSISSEASRPTAGVESSCTSPITQSPYFLHFPVQTLFTLGSPIALLLAFRRQLRSHQSTADFSSHELAADPNFLLAAEQVCNLFHSIDPCAYRLEPLLQPQFTQISPVHIPEFSRYPLGDGQPTSLVETLVRQASLFSPSSPPSSSSIAPDLDKADGNQIHQRAHSKQAWQKSSLVAFEAFKQVRRYWWGQQRIDYCLQCPDGLRSLLACARPTIFHASYWESKDVASFIMRQLLSILGLGLPETCYSVDVDDEVAVASFSDLSLRQSFNHPSQIANTENAQDDSPTVSHVDSNHSTFRVRLRRQVSDGAKNVKSNHRANDILVLEGAPQIITARFVFGLLDLLSMSNEKIIIQSRNPDKTWTHLGVDITDSSGRIHFKIPENRRFGIGLHLVVLTPESDADHPVKLTLAVVPPYTEAVVFSVDGSFAASLSIMGKDPKVRPGAVDVARHWQNLGYLLIYLSARPDMQKRRVTSWLVNHNFPLAITLFVEGISADPLRQKAQLLRSVVQQVNLRLHCAYGSGKDVHLYRSFGLSMQNIFVAGRISRNQATHSTPLTQGYAAHLTRLRSGDPVSKPASGAISASVRCFQFDFPLLPNRLPSLSDASRSSINS